MTLGRDDASLAALFGNESEGSEMKITWLACLALLVPALSAAQSTNGPYARIAVLRPHDGDTVDFEAGYVRHLEWHARAKDPFAWYGWTVWAGERQRWFVYATFGHSAEALNSPVSPAEDERDNITNVTAHAEFVGNALYQFLPGLSRGGGTPSPTPRLELTTFQVNAGAEEAFEAALRADQPKLQGETLWYRMVAGGEAPRYVRLRPRAGLPALLEPDSGQTLPKKTAPLIARTIVEILNLRPTMSYGVEMVRP
jgi:hypothetical protein